MDLRHSDDLPGTPSEVTAMLTERDYLLEYVDGLGAELVSADVDSGGDLVRTRLVAAVPTAGIPAVFARLVGSSITVVDERTYRPDGSGCDLRVGASVSHGRVEAVGTMTLTPADGGCVLRTAADIRAKVPLIGRQVEGAVHGLLENRVLRTQREVLTRRLSG